MTSPTKSPVSMISGLDNQIILSRTDLAAIALPVVGQTVYLFETGRDGLFVWRSGDYSAHVTLDTRQGIYVKATAIAASSGCWVRSTNSLFDVKWFGAVGDNVTNDRPAIDAAFAVAKAYGYGLHFPRGYYIYDCAAASVTWDFASVQYGFTIEGEGLSTTEIRISNPPSSGNSALYWTCSAGPQYDKSIKGLGIRGSFDGTVLTLGKNDLSDSFETSFFERFAVINSYAGGTVSEALRLNFVLGCTFINSRFGCYANGSGTNYGTALRMRQASFNTFLNTDYGNAARGLDFTDFGSYGNSFVGGGSENCHWHVSIRTSLATRNSWMGGRFSLWTQYAIFSSNGDSSNSSVFKNIAYNNGAGPSTKVDPSNATGVSVQI
jgi:hypothetical protein